MYTSNILCESIPKLDNENRNMMENSILELSIHAIIRIQSINELQRPYSIADISKFLHPERLVKSQKFCQCALPTLRARLHLQYTYIVDCM